MQILGIQGHLEPDSPLHLIQRIGKLFLGAALQSCPGMTVIYTFDSLVSAP
jgi:hypothetical protein